jgi:hypothetical protein
MKLLSISVPAILFLSFFTESVSTHPRSISLFSGVTGLPVPPIAAMTEGEAAVNLFDRIQPEAKELNREAFLMALRGYNKLLKIGKIRNNHVLTIIDYSLSSLKKRLFVVDMTNGKVLYNTYVAHGMNSGKEYARKFSNAPESLKSSLGFYVTMNTYNGKNGLTLRLKGVERGINDNALRRGIVVHGARYVNEQYCRHQGFMGRSQGCPAVPSGVIAPLVKSIKNGSAVFAYYPSTQYLTTSKLLADNDMAQITTKGHPVP